MSIIVENLSYIYMKGTPFEKKALSNVNLTIQDGEFIAIIGHTGSGKSTLIQHFNGLLKPTEGKITVDGVDVAGKQLKDLRKMVGIVFQYPEYQLFEETVYKDVAFAPLKQGLNEDEVKRRVYAAINAVGLDESIMEKSPFELSGGQKRRVAIAGVLAMNPKFLILDEPTAGLDPRGRDEIYGFITELHKNLGITVILVSHNMEDVARLVDRVIVMNRGTVDMDGKPSEIFKDAQKLETIGLTVPQITHLMKRLKEKIPEINDRIFTVDEARDEIMRLLGRKTHD